MPTYRLIADQQIQDNLGDVLTSYEQYMRDFRQSVSCPNGWTVVPRIVMQPGETAMQLRARILAAGPCDYNDLIGDSIPWFVLHEYPFGHYPDAVPGDGLYFTPGTLTMVDDNIVQFKPDDDPFGAFGRIGPYNVQSTNTDSSAEEYRQWFIEEMNPTPYLFAPEVWIDNHFAGFNADISVKARAQIPAGWTVKFMEGLASTGDSNDFIDGEWAQISERPVLVNMNFDGGFWNRLYNTGSAKDWRAANPGAYLEVIFGSEQDEFWADDNLMVAATATPYCNCAYCDWWGEEHLALFFAGRPIGDVQRAPGYYAKKVYGTIQGSCTHMLLDAQMALLEIQGRLSKVEAILPAVQADVAALKAATGGGGTGDTSGTVNYALGATVSASSALAGFPATAINNGDRKGLNWGSGGGWNSGVLGRFPEWIEIDLPTVKAVNRVVVFTVQDDFAHPIEPTDTLMFTKYGVQDFEVQAFISGAWQVVATVTGNSLVKRSVTFAAVTAVKWRVNITKAADGYSRVVEVEIYGP